MANVELHGTHAPAASLRWRELWLKEDWWAIWLGLGIVLVAFLFFANGSSIRWIAVTPALQTADDFRRVVVDYASEAAARGAVYIEAIFSPAEPAVRGVAWEQVFEGYCDGAQEARERLGIEVNLTPDITRTFSLSLAEETVRWCGRYRERGVVAVGLGGLENPPEQELTARGGASGRCFRRAVGKG